MADPIMSRGSGKDKDREPDKNKGPDKEKEHIHLKGKGKENALEKDKDKVDKGKTHHGGSAKKISAELGGHSNGPKHVHEGEKSTELKVKHVHAHHPPHKIPREHTAKIESINQRKLAWIEELKRQEHQIRAFNVFINTQLIDLFSKYLTAPEIAKTIIDIQKDIASHAIALVNDLPARPFFGTNIFHPAAVSPIDMMKQNQWIKFLEGVNKTLLDAGKMQAHLLKNDIYQDLLRLAQELHKNPSSEPHAKTHLKESHLKRK